MSLTLDNMVLIYIFEKNISLLLRYCLISHFLVSDEYLPLSGVKTERQKMRRHYTIDISEEITCTTQESPS